MNPKVSTKFEEKETVIQKSRYHLGDCWEIYTSDINDMHKYEKLALKHPDEVKIVKDDKYGMTFQVPLKWVKVTAPRKMSEEQKQKMSERMRAMREKSAAAS